MAATVTVGLSGFDKFGPALAALKFETQRSIAYSAVGAGAKVVRLSAQQNAQSYLNVVTGALIGNIAIVKKKRGAELYVYEVGVRHGSIKQKKDDDDPFYWWFHEFGYQARDGSSVPARPFLTPALEGSKNEALQAMAKRLQMRLQKYGLEKGPRAPRNRSPVGRSMSSLS